MRDLILYPLTVIRDRYRGIYSGGKWTAWNLEPYMMPVGPFMDDVGCAWFWDDNELPVGIGSSPEEAIEDLENKLKVKEEADNDSDNK